MARVDQFSGEVKEGKKKQLRIGGLGGNVVRKFWAAERTGGLREGDKALSLGLPEEHPLLPRNLRIMPSCRENILGLGGIVTPSPTKP